MTEIEIVSESEEPGRWRFAVRFFADRGTLQCSEVMLGWHDYNLWCPAGSDPPEAVMLAALRYLLDRREASTLPARFDASIVRRLGPDADLAIPRLVGDRSPPR